MILLIGKRAITSTRSARKRKQKIKRYKAEAN
jgi:hypothetical protein